MVETDNSGSEGGLVWWVGDLPAPDSYDLNQLMATSTKIVSQIYGQFGAILPQFIAWGDIQQILVLNDAPDKIEASVRAVARLTRQKDKGLTAIALLGKCWLKRHGGESELLKLNPDDYPDRIDVLRVDVMGRDGSRLLSATRITGRELAWEQLDQPFPIGTDFVKTFWDTYDTDGNTDTR